MPKRQAKNRPNDSGGKAIEFFKNLFRRGRPEGRIVRKRVRCGKAGCHCELGGDEMHGPYLYRVWTNDGRQYYEYLGKDESAGEQE